ncbi:hypothetical protein GCM10011343_12650 [Flavobacterium orientale]|uniref:FAR-17a/AIG1-like protein n=2 Tax=Flavobacterium orientale TaxID=1756020 RepID=A0A916XZB5_9FLAO|nr:hypothetical protein GCM10011343_12650 [Flavobacterium orientale]
MLLGWFAISTQYVLIIQNSATDTIETTIRFFSFFTILSNILVTLSFTFFYFNQKNFFTRYATQTALVVYISIVAIVYNLVLRFIWEPQGLQKVTDELLHVIVPILYVFYWIKFTDVIQLYYKYIFKILFFPAAYLVLILIRGHFSNYYPYPFIDVFKIGYNQVVVNSCIVLLAFVVVSLIAVRFSRR